MVRGLSVSSCHDCSKYGTRLVVLFAFEEWNWVSDRLIQEVRTEAAQKVDRELELDIMGCDIDDRMVEIAKANAQAAGVAGDITFKQMRVQDLRSDKINGVIISNPPYGERLSDDAGVTKLYAEMGQGICTAENVEQIYSN